MKKIAAFLITIFFLFGFQTKVNACSFFMGGEITWECIPYSVNDTNSGKFIFTLKVYQDCGSLPLDSNQIIHSPSPAGIFMVTEISGWPKDISPICNSNTSFPHISCSSTNVPSFLTGAVKEHIYQSQPIKIVGSPTPMGWMFYWEGCCRNATTNGVSNSQSFKLRAIMYPKLIPGAPNYGAQNTYPCFDSSPTFAESPEPAITTAYNSILNFHTEDIDCDSVVYDWGQALGANLGFPYSYNNPLPGVLQNPNNVPASLDSTTGLIQFKSYTTGAFLSCVKVTSYRNGIKLAEIWREFTVLLMDPIPNVAPLVTPVFQNNTFDTIVEAGSLVQFVFVSMDQQLLPNSTPQTMFITQKSSQFGSFVPGSGSGPSSLSSTTGCKTPPCATLAPASGINYTPSGALGYQSYFSWQTDCAHLVNCDSSKTWNDTVYYQFLFTVKDDYCPVPSVTTKIVTIGVTADLSFLDAPIVNSVYFNYNTNDVSINWHAVNDPMNKFLAYYIYYSPTNNGPYMLIDSVLNVSDTSYIHNIGQPTDAYYKIRTKSLNYCQMIDTSDYSSVLSMIITAVEAPEQKNDFVLFQNEPNPATNFTNIRFSIIESAKVEFILTDINGRIIDKRNIQAKNGDNNLMLSLENYSSGVYYYSIIYNGQKRTNKLIIR